MSANTLPFDDSGLDTLIVGGATDVSPSTPGLIDFVRRAPARCRRVAATCTGAFVLAEAGLLDGRRATTHWGYAQALRAQFPKAKIECDRIFVVDGPIWTSAGMIRINGGGYRRDHLRALAQRVEVADREVRIIGSKSNLLQTLTAATGVKPATPGVRSSVLKWRKECPLTA